jgi:hypothetical protein
MSDEAKPPKSERKWTITLYLQAESGPFQSIHEHVTGLFQQFGIVSFKLPNGLRVSARCTYVAMQEARDSE